MFSAMLNEVVLDFLITVEGPVLVKSGGVGLDPTRPDMEFVRTLYNGKQTVYLPGSTLKGVVRSYCEKIARTVIAPYDFVNGKGYCDPLAIEKSCAGRIANEEKLKAPLLPREQYRRSCSICKLFGSTKLASRVTFTDAYPCNSGDIKVEERTSVAIDRVTGAVAQGPFSMETVTQGSFKSEMRVRNFEVWQLGLLALALRDIKNGRVRLGLARSRGLGKIGLNLESLEIAYFGCRLKGFDIESYRTKKKLPLLAGPEAKIYGIYAPPADEPLELQSLAEAVAPFDGSPEPDDLRVKLKWTSDTKVIEVLKGLSKAWTKYVEG